MSEGKYDGMSYEEIQEDKATKRRDCQHHVGVYAFLQAIPDKQLTSNQRRQMDEAREVVRENYEEFFELMLESEFGEINFEFACQDEQGKKDSLDSLGATLMDERSRCPIIPTELSLDHAGVLLIKINRAETMIRGQYEQIEPAYRKWQDFEKRAMSIMKGICMLEKEWQAESVYQILVPADIYKRIRRMGEYVGQYKHRIETLHNAYEMVSRMITVYTAGQTSDYIPPRGTDAPETPSYRQAANRRGDGRPTISDRPSRDPEKPEPGKFGSTGAKRGGFASRRANKE